MPIMSNPFERVAVDKFSPIPWTKQRNAVILTLVDKCSMLAEAAALPLINYTPVAEVLFTISIRLDYP